jgi:cell division protein FtsW
MAFQEQTRKPDFVLLAVVVIVLLLGAMILSSASAMMAQVKYGDSYYLIRHQLIFGILPGLLAGFLAYKIPLSYIRKLAPPLLLISIVLLFLVFVPGFGFAAGGAKRWIHLGFATIQPAEILKPVFILYLASWLASRTERKLPGKNSKQEFQNTLAAFIIVMGLIGFLLLKQPDMSTFGIVALTAGVMYFLAGTPIKHSLFIIFAGLLSLAVLVWLAPYRADRLISWLSPESDPLGKGYQSGQALIVVGSGGIFGQGFGASSEKYTFLPELIGDSIFAPYAHELGFAGSAALIGIFAVFAWRGFAIVRRSRNKFESLAAAGITFWITVQAIINIAAAARMVPLGGIPLPFISYGGTAMIVELAAVGLLLNISRAAAERKL